MNEGRVKLLEDRTNSLALRLERVEAALAGGAATAPPTRTTPAAGPRATPERVLAPAAPVRRTPPEALPGAPQPLSAPAPRASLEDLLGGRVLAWIGGLAVLLGVAFLFAVAVSSGWIGEGARTLMAAAGSVALLAVGVWLRESRGRSEAAFAATGSAVAALFMTVTVAAQVYGLVSVGTGLVLAGLVGATATWLAVRWSARAIGALGILGALLAPALVGAPSSGETMGFLWIAGAAAAAVLVRQRWSWLAIGSSAVALAQWVPWLFEASSPAPVLLALVAFAGVGLVTTVGFELRVPGAELRISSSFLLALNALVLATAGWFALEELGSPDLGRAWLVALAFAHLAVGVATRRVERVSRDVGLLALALGAVLCDVAFALTVDGPLLAIAWTVTGVGFAALMRRTVPGDEAALVALGVSGHLALSVIGALAGDAPPSAVDGRPADLPEVILVLSSLAAGCFSSARLAGNGHRHLATALETLGLVVVAYLTAVTLDGSALVVAWSIEAVVLTRTSPRVEEGVARAGGLAFAAGALIHAVALEAPPDSLVVGLESPVPAALALGAGALASLACARLIEGGEQVRQALYAVGAVALLYLASAAVVTPFQPDSVVSASVLELGVRQQGQLLLSGLWSVVGLVAVIFGLRRDHRAVRLGALGLLLATVGKVFLYDLSALTSVYRVVSFIGLGLLLLVAAYAWQRLRPASLPDLRAAADGIA